MRIRPADPAADATAMADLCAGSLPLEPDAADLASILAAPRRSAPPVLLICERDGTACGLACGTLRRNPEGTVRGHVDLLAVAPAHREHGIGTRLLTAMEDRLRLGGPGSLRLGHNSPVYLWPGVDPRYTAMTCLAEKAGYRRYTEAVNLVADCAGPHLETAADQRRLAAAGIVVRRAEPAEAGALRAWLARGPWGDSAWPEEAERSVTGGRGGCHVAVRDGRYIAFACHGSNRRGQFGPMGTLPGERQHGVGSVLLRRCLSEIGAAGLPSAQIGWAGPVRYYARAVGARVDRVFWLYEKEP
ncbi:MAG: GNAT family N-acetyltransferase [Streptosporangiaceae bacterium]